MDWIGWTSAGSAVVTVVGAGVAWWRANISGRAKDAAERARDDAERTLVAVEAQAEAARSSAESVRSIAEQLAGPETWLEWEAPQRLSLRTRLEEITVAGLADEGRGYPFAIKGTPFVVTPHRPGVLYYAPTYASRGASVSVRLLIAGAESPLELPLPPGRPT